MRQPTVAEWVQWLRVQQPWISSVDADVLWEPKRLADLLESLDNPKDLDRDADAANDRAEETRRDTIGG